MVGLKLKCYLNLLLFTYCTLAYGQEDCPKKPVTIETLSAKWAKLKGQVDKINLELEGEYLHTNFGFKIHKECIKQWGQDPFLEALTTSVSRGIQCLNDLHVKHLKKKPKSTSMAYQNALKLQALWEKSPISIVCTQQNFNWDKNLAHASTRPGQTMENPSASHPFISLDPELANGINIAPIKKIDELTKTLFHEQVHNIGYLHEDSIEYPLACQTCCFGGYSKRRGRQASCRICTGVYSDILDFNYLVDLTTWAREEHESKRSSRAVRKYLKRYKMSKKAFILWAYANSNPFDAVGPEMAKLILKKWPSLPTPMKEWANKALTHQSLPAVNQASGISSDLAQARYFLYFEHNPQKAVEVLTKMAKELKALFHQQFERRDNFYFVNKNLKLVFEEMMGDLLEGDFTSEKSINQIEGQVLSLLQKIDYIKAKGLSR